MGGKSKKSNAPAIKQGRFLPQHNDNQSIVTREYREMYQGPIPPASEMSRYAQIDPSLPSRILAMAEKQSEHRQNMENTYINKESRQKLTSSSFAFLICITAIFCGTYCITKGKNISGLVLIVGALGSIICAFVYGKKEEKEERIRKWEETKPRDLNQDDSSANELSDETASRKANDSE